MFLTKELLFAEFRPVLESINLIGPQLCQISPGEGASTIEGLVTRDNRRFDAIAEQIQRKAERIHLSKQVMDCCPGRLLLWQKITILLSVSSIFSWQKQNLCETQYFLKFLCLFIVLKDTWNTNLFLWEWVLTKATLSGLLDNLSQQCHDCLIVFCLIV